jgi:hypothetical protein
MERVNEVVEGMKCRVGEYFKISSCVMIFIFLLLLKSNSLVFLKYVFMINVLRGV